MKNRIDKILVALEKVKTRAQAQNLIKEGVVFCNQKKVLKPSQIVSSEFDILEVKKEIIYVGRGAYKIEKAISFFKIVTENQVIADIGASTGGFTDYLLQHQAAKVYALDVGHGQMDPKLINDPRVVNLEGINIKYPYTLPEEVDLAVCDLSFISLKKVIHNIFSLVKKEGYIITLFKPQFEVERKLLNKKGIVKSKNDLYCSFQNFIDWSYQQNLHIQNITESPIKGGDGNTEFLILFKNIDQVFDIEKQKNMLEQILSQTNEG